jgi:hypothetical protein
LTRTFNEQSHVLSAPQEKVWKDLGEQLPNHWILYGDTALGLRTGHRHSPDFHFKSARQFNPLNLRETLPFLKDATVLKSNWNYLKVAVGGPTPVEVSFSGGQSMAQIHPPDQARNGLHVASLQDLAGEKMYRISKRVSERDWRDVGMLLYEGTSLEEMLRCAEAKYGERFEASAAVLNLTSARRSGASLASETKSAVSKEAVMARLDAPPMAVHSKLLTTERVEPAQSPKRQQNFERAVDPYDLHDPFDRPSRDLER